MTNKRRWQSRLACVWSVEKLFPTMETAQLFPHLEDLPFHFQKTAYLWTWTVEDNVAGGNVYEFMKRWAVHARWLKDSGKRLVRGLERGGKNGRYHMHAITDQHWDVNQIRKMAIAHGFGRINVKVIPREKVSYIAKYMGKPGRFPIPKNVRLWACIGFKGVRMDDIYCRITVLTPPINDAFPFLVSVKRWLIDGQIVGQRLVRPDWNGNEAEVQNMNITKENAAHIAALVVSGHILCVAEYRTCQAREIEFDEKVKGIPTGKRKTRKLVEHGVEREVKEGDTVKTEQLTVTTWLPEDANINAVKPAAAKGEPVVIAIDALSGQWGITASSIHSLANFNGKLS